MTRALTIVLFALLPALGAVGTVETRIQGYCVYCW